MIIHISSLHKHAFTSASQIPLELHIAGAVLHLKEASRIDVHITQLLRPSRVKLELHNFESR